ncbi:MAG: carbonic anhydrase [bacterium TMED88]|nr:carbonic anhydrase [Deltaproteobacteria bacterium]OUV36055.1 MAG: carbonic anhydrase [bacterium TMED88]
MSKTITQNADSQASMTPDLALEKLLEGNRRFVENAREQCDLLQQVNETRGGQWPFACLLGCIDSRASTELIFDAGIGDVFSARVAGNVVNEDILGSMEFACKVAGARLIMVLGHSACGAVKGACDDVQLGNLTRLLAKIRPAVDATPTAGERTSANGEFVQAVAEANVQRSLDVIREQSEVLHSLESEGQIRLVGAMYDVSSGQVRLLDSAA